MPFDNVKASLFTIAAMVMITTNDAIIKHITEVFEIGQIIFIRGVLACCIFGVVLGIKGQPIFYRPALHRWNLARGMLELMATLAFLTGLSMLPIATASTLGFSSPIFLAVLAAFIIREKVDWTRWAVILVGFGGVLLISNPFAESASWAVIFPIICAVFVALRDLAIRFVPKGLPTMQVAFTNAWIVMIGGGIYSIFQGWGSAESHWYLWFIGLAIAMYGGYTFYIIGTRLGELSFIGPFKYVSIILAMLYGYLIWDEAPTLEMIAGATIIVASGLFLLTRERKRSARGFM